MMKTYTENDLKQTVLTLEEEDGLSEDFQLFMLQQNEIPGFLKTRITSIDGKRFYHYDVSGKISLQTRYEKTKLRGEDIRRLIYAILQAVREVKNFMLDSEGILLDPEHIFCEEEAFFFCYYPTQQRKLTEEFHRLTEYFVREVDYKDQEGIHLAYTFHKSSMEENYSIEKIMDKIEEEAVLQPGYEELPEAGLDESAAIAEKNEFWEPVKRWFGKRKKEKWG